MTDQEIKESIMECTLSLADAIYAAGGHFNVLMLVLDMTAKELIATLGLNNIRFQYLGRQEKTNELPQKPSSFPVGEDF